MIMIMIDVFVDDLRLREADAEEYAEGEPLARILAMLKVFSPC